MVPRMTKAGSTDFLEVLCQMPLLEEAQRQELTGSLTARFAEPRDLARELMRRGWLTAFQLNQIFTGRSADLLLGPYLLLERLGEGGMGQVYKARHQRLNRIVALKVIRKERLAHPNAIPRFQREVQAAGQFAHVNIVRAYDAGQVNGTYFFAMEYVDGMDLDQLVKEAGPLEVAQACDYVRQAALGLQHAYERGVIHRDIKPANLLVARTGSRSSSAFLPRPACDALAPTASGPRHGSSALLPRPAAALAPWGVVKILDMGLARWQASGAGAELRRLTQVGSIMGTPDFIAPEQVQRPQTSDIRADLYSLGCTFYFLLTGQVPFPDGTLTEKLLSQQCDEPRCVAAVRQWRLLGNNPLGAAGASADVAPAVAAIVHKLLAKRPEDRYQLPDDVAKALAAVLEENGTALKGKTTSEHAARVLADIPARNKSQQQPIGPSVETTDYTAVTSVGAAPGGNAGPARHAQPRAAGLRRLLAALSARQPWRAALASRPGRCRLQSAGPQAAMLRQGRSCSRSGPPPASCPLVGERCRLRLGDVSEGGPR